MLRFAATRAQADDGCRASLRADALGELPLFPRGSLAHPDTDVSQASFRAILAKQFGQVVFQPNVGDLDFAVGMHPADEFAAHQGQVLSSYLGQASLRSPEERYRLLATTPTVRERYLSRATNRPRCAASSVSFSCSRH